MIIKKQKLTVFFLIISLITFAVSININDMTNLYKEAQDVVSSFGYNHNYYNIHRNFQQFVQGLRTCESLSKHNFVSTNVLLPYNLAVRTLIGNIENCIVLLNFMFLVVIIRYIIRSDGKKRKSTMIVV